jgi:uncharacterized damage-inducible protein DinB
MDCKKGNKAIIQQITQLLRTIDQPTYAKPLDIFNGASIGQHIRHILDFYGCLLRDVKAGKVDYANRSRNPLAETNPDYTLRAFRQIADEVEKLTESARLEVWGDFSKDEDEGRPVLESSVGRELMFAHDHAVHHLAIIKIGVQFALPNLQLDASLGVAPATVKHRVANAHP